METGTADELTIGGVSQMITSLGHRAAAHALSVRHVLLLEDGCSHLNHCVLRHIKEEETSGCEGRRIFTTSWNVLDHDLRSSPPPSPSFKRVVRKNYHILFRIFIRNKM